MPEGKQQESGSNSAADSSSGKANTGAAAPAVAAVAGEGSAPKDATPQGTGSSGSSVATDAPGAPAAASTGASTSSGEVAGSAVAGSTTGHQQSSAPHHQQGGAPHHQYNNYYTNSNPGKPYNNKQYNNSNGRQNNYNNNNGGVAPGGNSNRQHYNNNNTGRKGSVYSNQQKLNHNSQSQYNAYNQYPQNMYQYAYYGNPYGYNAQMVPGMPPVQAYTQAQAQLSSPQPAHAQTTQQQHPPSFTSSKIKITDKDGKQIDLEDKKKQSQASTPVSSPAQAAATPVSSATSTTTTTPKATNASVAEAPAKVASPAISASSPVVAAAATTSVPAAGAGSSAPAASAKLSIAEEFKRKIQERAAKAAQAQKKPEAKEEPSVEAAVVEPKAETKAETKVETKAEVKVEEPKVEPPKEEPKVVEEVKVEEPKVIQETKPEEPKIEEAQAEPKEEAKEVQDEIKPEESKIETTESESENKDQSESNAITSIHDTKDDADTTLDGDTTEESNEADVSTETLVEDDGFTLSNFFAMVSEASPIKDPFSHVYPEGIQGPDSKWKLESNNYRYDPVFLMQFRDVTNVTVDIEWKNKLESLGITGNKNRGGSNQSSRGGNQMGKFGNNNNNSMGGNRFNNGPLSRGGQFNDGRQNSRNGSKRRGGSSGGPRDKSTRKGQSKRGRDSKDGKEEPSKPVEEVKPLVKSENRWMPRSRAKKTEVNLAPDGSEILETEDIERKVKSLLNKLTLEMFEQITDDIMKIANQSKWEEDAKTVRQIISLTFAKACDEPYWSSMYAQFCAKMCKEMSDEIKDVSIIKNGEIVSGGDLARRILLATCQVEYEKGWTDKLPTNEDGSPLEPEMMSDEYYVMAAAKRRGLGLVKFIGHLYILNMLNDQVILLCLRDQSSNTEDPSEDRLENLAQLIKTVGARLEAKEKTKAALNFVFDNVQTILETCKLASRIKFMLMDLIDLRNANWVSAKSESGPKTIQEIHDEAELKKFEDEKANAERRRKNKMNDSRSNSSRAGSTWGSMNNKKDLRTPPQKDSRGFTSVSRAQSSRQNLASESNSAHLSPRDNSKRTDSIQSAANIFAALGDGEGEEEDHEDEAEAETPDVEAETEADVENTEEKEEEADV
ncbi:eukaryotic initiation factor 4F subunit p150 [[Candida] railenensis]|uniref:Eukaryotic initiation factor 4F subunit p150 n=1 Tax=[Candida] railenensis TaxID=45579 RepID=A0A9P0QL05_9ASCO|nr:eukaryotic initiation factor 4F subunit p150 [[Candida] railenensis]